MLFQSIEGLAAFLLDLKPAREIAIYAATVGDKLISYRLTGDSDYKAMVVDGIIRIGGGREIAKRLLRADITPAFDETGGIFIWMELDGGAAICGIATHKRDNKPEWLIMTRDVMRTVYPDDSVTILDESTLWTDEFFNNVA